MINIFINHICGLQRIIENKILLNTIYLIILITFFTCILLFSIFLKKKKYFPILDNSFFLEILIWIIPSIIIFFISIYIIKSSIYLNPLKNIYNNIKPIIIEIISINWKWMCIFPKQKIITFNEICIPTNIPIKIYILSNNIMNSLCIPKIGIQMYCMSNYNKIIYTFLIKHSFMHGLSSNFNGKNSSYMILNVFSVIKNNFYHWIKQIKKNNINFIYKNYNNISKKGFLIFPKFFNIRNNKLYFLILNYKK